MNVFWKMVQTVSEKMKIVSAAALAGMAALTCVDVVGRSVKHPVFGSVELVTLMGVFAVVFSLPFTHDTNGHIGVELFVTRLHRRTRALIDLCTACCGLAFFGLVTWRMFLYAQKMMASGEVSMNLELPEYAAIFLVSFCFVVFSLIIIKGLVKNYEEMRRK